MVAWTWVVMSEDEGAEDWGSVLEPGMERFADGGAVEGEGKQAVMEEGAVRAPAPWFLLTSGGLPKRACFPCLSLCVPLAGTQEKGKQSECSVCIISLL